jgi:hypothetical protein
LASLDSGASFIQTYLSQTKAIISDATSAVVSGLWRKFKAIINEKEALKEPAAYCPMGRLCIKALFFANIGARVVGSLP